MNHGIFGSCLRLGTCFFDYGEQTTNRMLMLKEAMFITGNPQSVQIILVWGLYMCKIPEGDVDC